MNELNNLITLLQKKLNDDPAVASDGVLIAKMLSDPKLVEVLQFRLRLVQLVGVIKFILKLPIENLDVEKKLLDRIEDQANTLKLKPALARLFFQTVIAHNKQLQYPLFDRLEASSKTDCLLHLNDFIELVKQDKPHSMAQCVELTKSYDQLSDKLRVGRELIQLATDHVLQLLGELLDPINLEQQVELF